MEFLKNKNIIFCIVLLFMGINAYFLFNGNYLFSAIPIVLAIAYIAIFHTSTAFLITVALTPFSINLEQFSSFGLSLYIPTEPILIGLMLLTVFKEIKSPYLTKEFWKHPLTLSISFYLLWVLITSITSTLPLISFKFLLMKLWYIIPIFGLGFFIFQKRDNIIKFLWCYVLAMTLVIVYTLVRHWGFNLTKEAAHWIMNPFYKDHTIYGAGVAISLFLIVGLIQQKRHAPSIHILLYTLLIITFVGLYYSYSRAAWASTIFALLVWICIRLRIKFKYLLTLAILMAGVVYFSWNQLEIVLSKNKSEHTARTLEGQVQSAANITSDASNLERLNRWSAAWQMFQDRPVFGFGPGTFSFQYAPYQDPEKLTVISTNFGNRGNAHSEYLGPLADMGILGILSVLFFVGTLFYSGITLLINIKYHTPEDRQMYYIILSLVLAISTYFFHGLINNFLETDKASIPIYCIAILFIAQKFRLDKEINTST